MPIELDRWTNNFADRYLRNGYNDNCDKLEKSYNNIEQKNEQAIIDSSLAKDKALEANELSNSVQQQLAEIVVNGDSSVEAAQARVDADNNAHFSLKERIDSDYKKNETRIKDISENVTELQLGQKNILDNYFGTKMIAHKGMMNLAPENSIPAFELAGRYGFEFIECDVSVTLDGVLIINHDSTVDAMTNGTGTIANMTYDQILSLLVDAGANVKMYEGTKLCTLEDVLKIAVKYNAIPFVELKNISNQTRDCTNVYNLLKKYKLTEKSVVASYNKSWLEFMRSMDKNIMLGVILNPWSTANVAYVKSLGNALLICDRYSATVENIQYCHENGVKMAIYSPTGTGSIDLLSEQQDYMRRGVDFILTGSLL
ncbi:glycerophosphodiester phosphodiesterase family protein [Bacillus anthracis]|uniref:glycerophosphodiester phosphodiesterase n=1 Tax=Bacillus anthracis TaxID=1392 RepID=UPI003D1DA436